MTDLIHISYDDPFSNWKVGYPFENEHEKIDEYSIGRICAWGAHYIAVIHDDVPEDDRKEIAEFIAGAPDKIKQLTMIKDYAKVLSEYLNKSEIPEEIYEALVSIDYSITDYEN